MNTRSTLLTHTDHNWVDPELDQIEDDRPTETFAAINDVTSMFVPPHRIDRRTERCALVALSVMLISILVAGVMTVAHQFNDPGAPLPIKIKSETAQAIPLTPSTPQMTSSVPFQVILGQDLTREAPKLQPPVTQDDVPVPVRPVAQTPTSREVPSRPVQTTSAPRPTTTPTASPKSSPPVTTTTTPTTTMTETTTETSPTSETSATSETPERPRGETAD